MRRRHLVARCALLPVKRNRPTVSPPSQPKPKKIKRRQLDVLEGEEVRPLEEEIFGSDQVESEASHSSVESSSPKNALVEIVKEAKKLRQENPGKYGIKGTRQGTPGYVENGWQLALKDAAANLGCKSKPNNKKKEVAALTRAQKAAKQAYLEELRNLQVKYFPMMGRKLSAKAVKQANKKVEVDNK